MIIDPEAAEGEVIWSLGSDLRAGTNVARFSEFLRRRGVHPEEGYDGLWQWSVDEPEQFWSRWAEFAGVKFGGEAGPVRTAEAMPHTRWFPGRTLNYARHLLDGHDGIGADRHRRGRKPQEITFDELRREVGAFAAHLRSVGVEAGDRVVAILPNVGEAVVALLATASIGAIWSVCAPEFGAGAISSRFQQLEPKVVIAAPGYRLGGKDRDRGDRAGGGVRIASERGESRVGHRSHRRRTHSGRAAGRRLGECDRHDDPDRVRGRRVQPPAVGAVLVGDDGDAERHRAWPRGRSARAAEALQHPRRHPHRATAC